MNIIIYIASAIAVFSSVMVITRLNAVSALLYMIVSLLSVAVVFFLLGSPFIAVLEVIIYAGAIMVLFVFVVMMLNLGNESVVFEKRLLTRGIWTGPVILAGILLLETGSVLFSAEIHSIAFISIGPKEVGRALFGPYMIGVELAAFLLMAGIVGAYHLGKRKRLILHRYLKDDSE
jgi:NADH-quinone oxidoreductase subunit J